MKIQMLGAVAAVAAFSVAEAADVTFTGGAGVTAGGYYEWTDGGNWSSGAEPTGNDTVIFDTAGAVSVNTATTHTRILKHIRVLQGEVTIGSNGYLYYYGYNSTSEWYVAGSSSLTISNTWDAHGTSVVFNKTGPGLMKAVSSIAADYNPLRGCVSEGVLQIVGSGHTYGIAHTVVKSGAKFYFNGYNDSGKRNRTYYPVFHLEENAVFELNGGSGRNYVGGFSGSGMVVDRGYYDGKWSDSPLTIEPKAEMSAIGYPEGNITFDGKFLGGSLKPTISANSTSKFLVSDPDAFRGCGNVVVSSGLGFAEGNTDVYLNATDWAGTEPVLLETTAGEPVKLSVYLTRRRPTISDRQILPAISKSCLCPGRSWPSTVPPSSSRSPSIASPAIVRT